MVLTKPLLISFPYNFTHIVDCRNSIDSCSSQPNVYGLLSGYSSVWNDSYWIIHSHIVPCEESIIHLAMSDNTCDEFIYSAFTLNAILEDPNLSSVVSKQSQLIQRKLSDNCIDNMLSIQFFSSVQDVLCSLSVYNVIANIKEQSVIQRIIFNSSYCLQSDYYLLDCSS